MIRLKVILQFLVNVTIPQDIGTPRKLRLSIHLSIIMTGEPSETMNINLLNNLISKIFVKIISDLAPQR